MYVHIREVLDELHYLQFITITFEIPKDQQSIGKKFPTYLETLNPLKNQEEESDKSVEDRWDLTL